MATGPTVYDSERRLAPAIEELVEVYRYRALLGQLVRRDVVTRYKRSILGIAWTMLNPLGLMVVVTLAFSQLFSSTRAFPVFLLTGLIVYNFVSQVTAQAMAELSWGGALLRRIYLPRTTFALSATGSGLVNLCLSLVPLVLLLLVFGVPLRPAVFVLPIAVLFLVLFTVGLSLALSTLNMYFTDVAEMYQIVLLAWLYLTPIFYPEEIVQTAYRWWIFNLNPLYHLVKLFRHALYFGTWPEWATLIAAAAFSGAIFAGGWMFFARKADEVSYRL